MNDFEKPKILIVDDIPTNITILTEILMADYKLICTTNGKDVLELSLSLTPDIILLDIMMPDLDGYEVCRQLKSDSATKTIPVVFLTAKNEEEDETLGLEIGAVDYISKPFSATILQHKVRIQLELKQHRDNLEEIIKQRTVEITKSNEKLQIEMSERLLVQKALIEQRANFFQLFENSPQAIMLLDPEGKVKEVNKGFGNIFGYTVKEIKGQYKSHVVVPEDMISENEILQKNILSGKTINKETIRIHKNGTLIPVSLLGYPAWVKDKIEGIFIIYRDVSQRKNYESQLLHQALHDPLTGIPNRALLMERLERALGRSKRREDYKFAVLMIDLDHFKTVNDMIGHLAGDQLLIKISEQIKKCIRATDTIARMGGDEFAILIEEFKADDEVLKIAKRIHQIAESTFSIEETEVNISASIGIVLNTKPYDRAEYILRDADIAMYRVKKAGKSRFKIFDKTMHEATVEALKFKTDLQNAITNKELVLYYQPILSTEKGELMGFEALVRWIHPVQGIISPNKFIPLAEETGLIIPLGELVIREACRQLKQWHVDYPRAHNLTMNVNISIRQFMETDLENLIINVLEEHQLNPCCLKLEITESLLVRQAKTMAEKLAVMKNIGVKMVLDDFGTGYSSLSYIQNFPIDNIKIDRSFINSMDTEKGSKEIVKTIILLCKNLGLGVVAEGVERETQLNILRKLECDSVQGFYFSKPVDKDKAYELIKRFL